MLANVKQFDMMITSTRETEQNKMNADERIEKIVNAIESGKTVRFETHLRVTPVNLKTLNKFRAAGYELFKAQGDSVMMRNGKRWECVDGCRVTVQG